MWIKICGNTNLEDALHATHAGASALGFVFAKSPRRVTAEQVAAITPHLPDAVEKIGVFADMPLEEITAAVQTAGLTGVQLHGVDDLPLASRLRAFFAAQGKPSLRIIQVLHYRVDAEPAQALAALQQQLQAVQQEPAIDAVLVDSRTATASGGTGIRFDWQAAQRSFAQVAPQLRLIAAGGLKAENVAEAIRTLQPWGVDVASGVEATPGRKDPSKVEAFIRNAQQARR
ncbi:MAG: phosphoribosylanthranilate isomerase [Acidobacteriaceae bacterium]